MLLGATPLAALNWGLGGTLSSGTPLSIGASPLRRPALSRRLRQPVRDCQLKHQGACCVSHSWRCMWLLAAWHSPRPLPIKQQAAAAKPITAVTSLTMASRSTQPGTCPHWLMLNCLWSRQSRGQSELTETPLNKVTVRVAPAAAAAAAASPADAAGRGPRRASVAATPAPDAGRSGRGGGR